MSCTSFSYVLLRLIGKHDRIRTAPVRTSASRHEWKIAFFSPENMPIAYHLHKLAEKLTGHRFTPGPGMTEAVYGQAVGWLDRNVSHILPDDGSYGIDHILEKARQVVRRKGGAHPRHRPHEPPGTTSGTGADGNGTTSPTLLNKLGRFATRSTSASSSSWRTRAR